MTAPKGSPTHAHRLLAIARNTFDPDSQVTISSFFLSVVNDLAEARQVGVKFTPTMRSFFVDELWPGAVDLAIRNDTSEVGGLLRFLQQQGALCVSAAILEGVEHRARKEQNSRFRKLIRKKRNTRAGRDLAQKAKEEALRSRNVTESVALGDAVIDRAIRSSPDWGDVAAYWPKEVRNGVSVPIVDPHEKQVL